MPEHLNIRANVNGTPGSVRFVYDGNSSVENKVPFSLFGDIKGNYNSGTFSLGKHTLTSFAYTSPKAKGVSFAGPSIQFYVLARPANQPPSVTAYIERETILYNPTFTFATLYSQYTDPDGISDIVDVSWSQVSGPLQVTLWEFKYGTTPEDFQIGTYVFDLIPGTFVFRVIVKDSLGAQDTADVKVIVIPENSAPSVTAWAENPTIPYRSIDSLDPTYAILYAQYSDPDGDSDKLNVSWSQISGPSEGKIFPFNNDSMIVLFLVPGTYVFRATVEDRVGAQDSADVTLIVIDDNSARKASTGTLTEFGLAAYPNPSSDRFILELSGTPESEVSVEIIDGFGKPIHKIYEGKLLEPVLRLNWDGKSYTDGIYYCKITTNKESKVIRLMLKK